MNYETTILQQKKKERNRKRGGDSFRKGAHCQKEILLIGGHEGGRGVEQELAFREGKLGKLFNNTPGTEKKKRKRKPCFIRKGRSPIREKVGFLTGEKGTIRTDLEGERRKKETSKRVLNETFSAVRGERGETVLLVRRGKKSRRHKFPSKGIKRTHFF